MYTKSYFIYILSNYSRSVFYIGMTNNLVRRLFEHQNNILEGFTKKYQIKDLLFFEETSEVHSALAREKQIKKWSRKKKIELIRLTNPFLLTLQIT